MGSDKMDYNSLESRLEEIESRLSFQDNHIQELNDIISKLQLEVMTMAQRLSDSERQIQEITPSLIKSLSEETPPPHY
ncbi:MAG: SlyX family protein [Gammaproteobacteria bacterium]|uniref:Protein SlyX homolog n=1 Tax=Candidatus Thiopontia autotrophica TaxID=2841688 RepID=A0A8J6P7G7_9GAMM|nr:SlyX family protein [Candidatus Thiopontia autotrophica]MBL6969205.1 SlyX family protein [Gammaproteobacteria bacterium]